jgi:hypothetical protein
MPDRIAVSDQIAARIAILVRLFSGCDTIVRRIHTALTQRLAALSTDLPGSQINLVRRQSPCGCERRAGLRRRQKGRTMLVSHFDSRVINHPTATTADRAAKIIQDALGIETDDFVNYTSPIKLLANGSRSACLHHRRLAQSGGLVLGLNCYLVVPAALDASWLRLLTPRPFSTL